jgi:hypothetical protein
LFTLQGFGNPLSFTHKSAEKLCILNRSPVGTKITAVTIRFYCEAMADHKDPKAQKTLNIGGKLSFLECFHIPIYMSREFKEAYINDISLEKLSSASEAKIEIISIYERAFKEAYGVSRQAKILQSFVSNFPKLALHEAEWFWNLLSELHSKPNKDSKQLLRAIARGIVEPERALSKFHKQHKIEQARKLLRDLKQSGPIQGYYLKSNLEYISTALKETRRDKERYRKIEKSIRPKIESCLLELECPLTAAMVLRKLKNRGVAATLLIIAAAIYDIRARSLASMSPIQEP